VHVKSKVEIWAVVNDKRVVPVQPPHLREKRCSDRIQHRFLQSTDQRLQPNLVDDQTVIIHAVWPAHGETRFLVVCCFIEESFEKIVRKDRKSENLRSNLGEKGTSCLALLDDLRELLKKLRKKPFPRKPEEPVFF